MNKPIPIILKVLGFITSGFLCYYSYKVLYPKSKKIRNDKTLNPYKIVRMKVPTYAKGAIIGKNGTRIRSIQDNTRTTIKFISTGSSDDTKETCDLSWVKDVSVETWDELMIRGETDAVLEAEMKIKSIVNEMPVYKKEVIVIQNRFIGKLIGKKGENVKRLKEFYKVSIDINELTTDEDREVTMRGISANIENCKKDIMQMINDHKNELYMDTPRYVINPSQQNIAQPIEESIEHDATNWKVGETKEIYVSSVVDCVKFYGQLPGEQLNGLNNFVAQMTRFYNDQKEASTLLSNVVLGDILAGYHEATHSWQRCKIIEVDEADFVVKYSDYGDSAILKRTQLRQLESPRFTMLPYQALSFIRYRFETSDRVWSEQEIEQFEAFVYNKEGGLKACLKEKIDDKFIVELAEIDNEFPVAISNSGDDV